MKEKIKLPNETIQQWRTWLKAKGITEYSHSYDDFKIIIEEKNKPKPNSLMEGFPPWMWSVIFFGILFFNTVYDKWACIATEKCSIPNDALILILIATVGLIALAMMFNLLVKTIYEGILKNKSIGVREHSAKEEYYDDSGRVEE